MKRGLKLFTVVKLGVGMVVAASLLLAGCGGGGGGGGSSASASGTLGGVAAVGSPIVNGTVTVVCAGGGATAAMTSSTGAWQVPNIGQTLPCAVQVSYGSVYVNGVLTTAHLHSVATSFGTVNITPLTDLLVANLAGTSTPDVWFAGLTPAALASITPTQVNTALTNLRTALGGLTPLGTINPITIAFTPTAGNASDDMLVALKTAMTNTGVTYAALLSNASMPSFTPPVSGFGTALTTAYAGTTSGGTPITGTGVAFSGNILGQNSVANTSISNGVFVAGGLATDTGSTYVWTNAGGNSASLHYFPNPPNPSDAIIVGFFLMPGLLPVVNCGVSSSFGIYPLCSSVGITFDRAAGRITFASTPLLNSVGPSGITATGSLSFTPF